MAAPVPSVGRIVHYVSHGSPVRPDGTQAFTCECRAAMVTEVDPDPPAGASTEIGLAVFNPTGMFFNRGIPQGEPGTGGTWHWPERVG